MRTSIDLPFTPADVLARAEKEMRDGVADKVWPAIMADPELKRARSRLSIHEFRLIVAHCLNQMQPAAGETIRTTRHGSMEAVSVTAQSAVDAASPELEAAIQRIVEDAMDSAIPEPWEVSAHAAKRIITLLPTASPIPR